MMVASPGAMRAQLGTEGGEATPQRDAIVPHRIADHAPRPVFNVLDFRDSTSDDRSYPDSTRVDLYLAVPYHSLEFLFSGANYIAEYSVSLRISTPADDRSSEAERSSGDTAAAAAGVTLDLFKSYDILEPAAEHHEAGDGRASLVRADAQQLSFHLPIGKAAAAADFRVQLTLHDSYGRRDYDTTFNVRVKRFAANTPAMSDLLLYRDREGMNIVPSIGPDVSSLESRIGSPTARARDSKGFFAELYDMPAAATLGIVSEVIPDRMIGYPDSVGTTGTIISRSTMTLETPPAPGMPETFTAPASTPASARIATTPLFAPLDLSHLWPGVYELRTYILPTVSDTNISDPAELSRRALAFAQRTIRVRIAEGIDDRSSLGTLTDLDQEIEQLHIIATSTQWDSLSHARTREQKRNAILDFWSMVDHQRKSFSDNGSDRSEPGPGDDGSSDRRAMDVFYSRIEYADAHFGTGSGSGWKTDRGRVYIALGEPDQIEDHQQGYSQTFGGMQPAYQVWNYNRQRTAAGQYVFVDDYGLGDYRLRGAFPPEGTFQY